MTTAEMLRREGEARGKIAGKAEGKREALLLQLRQRFGRLHAAAVARIEAAGVAELDTWFSRVLTASTLDDVVGVTAVAPRSKAAPPARPQARHARQRARS